MTPSIVLLIIGSVVIFAPNFVIWYFGKKYLPVMPNIYSNALIKSALFALAFSPSIYGHAAIVPAVWLLLFASEYGRVYGLIPILIVWVISFIYVTFTQTKRVAHT
jgi:hypothetical protein